MAHLAHGVALTHVDEGVTVPLPALPACGKLVVFIRHGQSIANTVPEGPMKLNPELLDCPLTELGHQQARGLQGVLPGLGLQAVYCSPLTRAIQTACLAFENQPGLPITAWPTVTEFYPHLPECQGRPPAEAETIPFRNLFPSANENTKNQTRCI
eukprot:m.316874 g.316874  ORF g.316874 m.316874 type:complete len:155 (-) comp19682_c0_seq5:77-541(-)